HRAPSIDGRPSVESILPDNRAHCERVKPLNFVARSPRKTIFARQRGTSVAKKGGHESFDTTQSMDWVSAVTSSGSIAGNMPMRSWLRPNFRYGSVSTIPFARSALATAAASTESTKSIVPTTCERFAGSLTNGVANSEASAHSYSRRDDSRV